MIPEETCLRKVDTRRQWVLRRGPSPGRSTVGEAGRTGSLSRGVGLNR